MGTFAITNDARVTMREYTTCTAYVSEWQGCDMHVT